MPRSLDEIVPHMSARSVVLSLLLGVHPPQASGQHLVQLGEHFGVAANTIRVALSRMVANGDLHLDDSAYRLAPRHLERQRHTDAMMNPTRATDNDAWRMIVLTGTGRSATARAQTRDDLRTRRFAELREGVWLRPDNLVIGLELDDVEHTALRCSPESPRLLAARLWDLETWHAEAAMVLDCLNSSEPMTSLRAAAAAIRLLMTDPALPAALLPDGWPAADLSAEYQTFRRRIAALTSPGETANLP